MRLIFALAAFSMPGFAQVDPGPKVIHRLIGDVSIANVEFQKPAGTMARIKMSSQSAARTIKFEAIDQHGKLIAPLPAMKAPEDGEYLVLADAPRQLFRIRAVGLDLNGAPYERIYPKLLFPPTATKHAAASGPLAAEITLSTIDVSSAGYEPLVNNSNVIGIRVWYSVRFSADGEYSLDPRVFPVYEDSASRGLVAMRVLREKMEPPPEAGKFRGETEYRVVLEMIPDYIVANSFQTKFCIYEAKFPAFGKGRDAWNVAKSLPAPIQYRVEIPGLNFVGETELFHPQRTFYEAFLKQGAFDCGPEPNKNF